MNNTLPDNTDLKVFNIVIRHNSFRKAADSLGVSPAYISKRISTLEKTLGCTLLHRKTRVLRLTQQGQILYEMSQQLLHELEHMTELIRTPADNPSGNLTITSSFGFGRTHVAPILASFHQLYPAISIKYELTDKVRDLLKENVDLDIRIGNTIDPNLLAKFLHKNKRILCATPEYLEKYGTPKNLQQLSQHQCLVIKERDHPFGIWQLKNKAGYQDIKINGDLASNDGGVVRHWALSHKGIMLRSVWDISTEIQQGILIQVLPEYWQDADIWAVYPSRLSASAKLRVCVEYFEQELPKRLKHIQI